jgi:hypothetical protein
MEIEWKNLAITVGSVVAGLFIYDWYRARQDEQSKGE